MTLAHSFPLDQQHNLLVAPMGAQGALALACLLGMRTLPIPVTVAHYERAEWADILAKMRGMEVAGVLRQWPIYRAYCGCHLQAAAPTSKAVQEIGKIRDVVYLVFCTGHRPCDPVTQQPVPEVLLGMVRSRP